MCTSKSGLAIGAALVFAGWLAAPPLALGADTKSKAAATTKRAKDPAPAQEADPPMDDMHLQIAYRVLTGDAACEFNQSVSVWPIEGKPGYFRLTFKKVSYTMVPEETTSGAVRLEDKKAGVVWLQIPSKSMLMNSKIGQRMVDGCQADEQRAATRAVEAAASAIKRP
jgi:hypothetical protein